MSDSINDLPNEILEEILGKLSCESDLCNTKLVCRRWRLIVDELVGHIISVTNFTDIFRHLSSKYAKSLLMHRFVKDVNSLENFPQLAIKDLSIGVPGLLISDALTTVIEEISRRITSFPTSVFPHVLQRLTCYEPLPANIFHAISPMSNLRYLEISLFSLSSLSTAEFNKNLFAFRCLKTLVISETSTYPEFNSTAAILPLNNFLKNLKAPNLVCLDIAYPILSLLEIEEDSTRFIMHLIKRSYSMKSLSIAVFSPNQNFTPPSKLFQYPSRLMEEMTMLGKNIQLKSVVLEDNHLHSLRPSVQTKAWIVFIKQQTNLYSLKFHLKSSIDFSKDVIGTVQNNEGSLKTLDLSCFPCEIRESGDVSFVPIEGNLLSKCSSLRVLKLSDKIVNTINLPNSLTYVYIDAMLTNLDAHNIVVSEHNNLKWIHLKDLRGGAPKRFGFGIKLETLRQFVNKRTVQRLVIYAGSTDDKFPKAGIPNGETDNPKRLRKRKSPTTLFSSSSSLQGNILQSQVRIDWELNCRGYYENKHEEYEAGNDENNAEMQTASQCDLYQCDALARSFH